MKKESCTYKRFVALFALNILIVSRLIATDTFSFSQAATKGS
jgi:hypothetical protein